VASQQYRSAQQGPQHLCYRMNVMHYATPGRHSYL